MSDGRGSEFVMMFHTFVLADLYPALVDEHVDSNKKKWVE